MTNRAFDLVVERHLAEVSSTARFYRHRRTGAEVLSLANADENKVFGIAFRTPPSDSTGVAHIMEHSVLCGSRKYPVKEPFVELMKGSLHTFLNAMTYPDKTVYPVASQNLQDFYNLVDVYLDAVFFPRISEDIFRQEGWHYELPSIDDDLRYKGVVFNEMKGAYSQPESRLGDYSQHSLYPDTTYGFDSGGDPARIPDLTYTAFRDFHARHYHPSNARAFFYGDDDPAKRLAILDEYFADFDPVRPDSMVALQPRFRAPVRVAGTYAADPSERRGGKAMVTVNWMLDEEPDPAAVLARDILDFALLGTPASPLRKALIDSGLGESLVGGGLQDDLRQPMFSVGLKGVAEGDTDKVEAVILDTLGDLAARGIDPQTMDAALNTTEFRLRENNTGAFPRGISLMLRSLRDWLHDRDPMAPIAFDAPLAEVRASLLGQDRPFAALIQRYFMDNRHRATVTVTPDSTQAEREAAAERARLQAIRESLPEADLGALVAATAELRLKQETPDPPEALATIPGLALSDLPRQNKAIPVTVGAVGEAPLLAHDLDTNGVIYLDLAFDLQRLSPDLLPYMGVFSRALLETGAGERDFIALSQRIGRETGGVFTQRWTSATAGGKGSAAWFFVRGKAVPERLPSLFAILRDVLLAPWLHNRERLRQLVMEEKASFEGRLAPMGLRLVDLRLRGRLHPADWAAEQMGGLTYLFFLRRLSEQIEHDWDSVSTALATIRAALVDRAVMVCNLTANADNLRLAEAGLTAFLADVPRTADGKTTWDAPMQPGSEGLAITALVNFVGKGADLFQFGYRASGAAAAAVKHLNTGYLWEKVRVQGGAYGGSSRFDRLSGGFTFLSYRDPNLLATLDIYDRAGGFLLQPIAPEELKRSVIGAIGDMDRYMLPDAKGMVSLQRHLSGDDEARRQRVRDELLSATQADFRQLGDALAAATPSAEVVVIGSESAIAAANSERQGFLAVTKVL